LRYEDLADLRRALESEMPFPRVLRVNAGLTICADLPSLENWEVTAPAPLRNPRKLQPSAAKAPNKAPPEREFLSESGELWRGGRDSKAQLPAVSPRKRRGQDP
jgi:hypothetical protein